MTIDFCFLIIDPDYLGIGNVIIPIYIPAILRIIIYDLASHREVNGCPPITKICVNRIYFRGRFN